MHKRTAVVAGVIVGVIALTVQMVGATAAVIDDQILTGGGSTTWDPNWDTYGCVNDGSQYSPVSDGTVGANADAFDDALTLKVDGLPWDDLDGSGNRVSQQLAVGPTTVAGLKISRVDRALSTSPTLRDLVKITNNSGVAVTRTFNFESNVGSDSSTIVEVSSSGDANYTAGDRWVISTDTSPYDDPPVTHVLFGKHAPKKVVSVISDLDGVGVGCLDVDFVIKVPAHSTRYLLFFLQMHPETLAPLAASAADAGKFNKRTLNKGLLTGLSNKVKARIVNWDLT